MQTKARSMLRKELRRQHFVFFTKEDLKVFTSNLFLDSEHAQLLSEWLSKNKSSQKLGKRPVFVLFCFVLFYKCLIFNKKSQGT